MHYNLTEYSHGAGCGCKLSPGVLSDILKSNNDLSHFNQLLVGNEASDDAAVMDLDGETAIVSTTDFFMPIVDDPHDFGAIAATNAISDIYAMGAEPLMAIAILGWPIEKLPAKVAAEVLKGGREVCRNAGIPLAGGHSIDSPEPIFGLAVTGRIAVNKVKKNSDGRKGDLLYLTKPLGTGVATTAHKKKIAEKEDLEVVRSAMITPNTIGRELGSLTYVHAMTDVTGFGLGGHLLEMCRGSDTCATIYEAKIPVFDFVWKYIDQNCIPGGTNRNWETYGSFFELKNKQFFKVLADPQTSGGLLVSVDPGEKEVFESLLKQRELDVNQIGVLTASHKSGPIVSVV